ncbi:apolipoprotein N-acyltransferase [Mycobacterium sp.]|uniref:apolipoprotein N-acyltransferase n=1 Tax=Mycobacterium sp. TaxID=1785 RepID=UPI003C75217B
MAKRLRRFDRRMRPGEDTEVIPAVEDDDTGVIPAQYDDDEDDDDDTEADLEPNGNRVAELASQLGQRLVQLGGVMLAWLGNQLRTRLPQFGTALQPRLTRLSAAILAGLLLCSSYPGFNWWWAAILAFAVLAWVLTRPATTPLGGFGYGFLFGLAFYLPLIRWVSLLVGAVPLLALVLLCSLFPGIFGLLAVVVRHLPGWPIWFAVLWAAQEWLKSTIPFGGFPWGVVAAGQTDGPFLPLVRLGGVPLLSLAIVLISCSATAIAFEIASWLRASRAQAAESPPAVMLPAICICLVFFATAAIWPQVRHSGTGSGNEPVVTAAVVQGNVPRLGLEFNAQRLAVLANDVRETRQLADDVHAGRAPQPDFVVWPEDASEVDPLRNPDAAQQISAAVEAIGAPILVGTVLDIAGRPSNAPAQTNTVIVWNPKTGPADRHDKRIVQPFGEYLPWRGFFRHLSGLADWAGYIVPGTGTGVVRAAGVPVGVATCWEVIFNRALRDSVRNGAEVLAVPANNANFNQTMSEQQLAFSKVRAVELDRYAVVASNVGISALVTPDGRELARTSFFEPAYLANQVRRKTTLTPAAKWGPAVQGSLIVTAVAVLLAAMLHNGWFTEINRRRSELAKNFRPAKEKFDDDLLGDDEVADGELDEYGDDAALDEGGRHSARHGPEEGDT